MSQRRALFPGSFDPFTIGHASIVRRGLQLFDHIVIAVGICVDKHCSEEISRRLEPICRFCGGDERLSVISYNGLTVDAARENDCGFILRGVRNVKDFEYERDMADVNRKLSGIETVMLFSLPELSAVSSSVVRELKRFGRDVSEFLP